MKASVSKTYRIARDVVEMIDKASEALGIDKTAFVEQCIRDFGMQTVQKVQEDQAKRIQAVFKGVKKNN